MDITTFEFLIKGTMVIVEDIIFKVTIIFSVSWLCSRCQEDDPGYEDDSLYYLDDNGTEHIMNFSTIPKSVDGMSYGDAYFYLYTRNNIDSPELIALPKNNHIKSAYFNQLNDLRIVTHGWLSTYKVEWLQNIKNSLLREYNLNVITVDWSELSQNTFYPWPALSTRYIGKRIAKFLKAVMQTYNFESKKIHLIGHSLGAHVMGYAGMFLNGSIQRITGLDPARPLFEVPQLPTNFCLDNTDAEFVDIIHTAGGSYGYYKSFGDADFYPNKGIPVQPGCKIGVCSHGRACEFFDESISYTADDGFISYPCKDWDQFSNGYCNANTTSMGYLASVTSRGNYYLHTRNESKYAILE